MAHPAAARVVVATVQQVLPRLGLAYAVDEEDRCWGITRSTPGADLDQLDEGRHVQLTIEEHGQAAIASAWTPLD
jgi:hypothetical protein